MSRIDKNGLKISSTLFEFINNDVIPGTNLKSDDFWNKFEKVVHELAPVNKNLIQKREDIQKKIDTWHNQNKGKNLDKEEYNFDAGMTAYETLSGSSSDRYQYVLPYIFLHRNKKKDLYVVLHLKVQIP